MTTEGNGSLERRWQGPPLALFPATYLLHVAEEFFSGESFPVWASRVSGTVFSNREFVILNTVAFMAMCGAVVAARRTTRASWAIAALGTVTLANGSLHVVASIVTGSYSPGVVSGLLVWIPLGALTLRTVFACYPTNVCLRGCAAGLLAHAVVSALAFVL